MVLEGLRLAPPSGVAFTGSFVEITNCQGRVHCDGLAADLLAPGTSSSYGGVSIPNSAHVSLHGCDLQQGAPVIASSSTVLITDSFLIGQQAFRGLGGFSSSSRAVTAISCQPRSHPTSTPMGTKSTTKVTAWSCETVATALVKFTRESAQSTSSNRV